MYRKTQVAIEYAYRIRDERPDIWVFWVHVSSTARVEEGFRKIAERIQAPCLKAANAKILEFVSHWLGTHGPWVLILDNADDMDVLCRPWGSQYDQAGPNSRSLLDYLPSAAHGSVLITSRNRKVGFHLSVTAEHMIEVKPMDPDTARVLLRKKLTVPASVEDVKALVLNLDGLPLAITQAAAFINQRYPWMTVSRYLEELQHGDQEYTQLLQRDVGDQRRYGHASNSALMTWRISFEHIRRTQPSAARLLAFMSCFDSQAIPEGLLHGYQDEFKSDDFDFEADVDMLQGYSLIRVQAQDKLEMHRLVQIAMRDWLELNEELEEWQEKYVRTMEDAFPDGRYENWPQCQILFPHVETMLRYRIKDSSSLELWAMVLFRASCYADEQGWFGKAEEMAQASLLARTVILGKDHLDTLSTMIILASVYRNKGRGAEAEALEMKALEKRRQILGEEHPDTLISMANLALTYRLQGRLREAEALEVKALEKRRQILGEEHPDTLISMANLASTYQSQGRLQEAEALEMKALEKMRRILGEEHPDTLISMANLASTYSLRGQWTEAEALSETVLQVRTRVLGKEHPTTLNILVDLASIYNRQGQYKRAEALHSEALLAMQRVLGEEHPSTLATMNDLADVLSNQGMYQPAEKMYRSALAVMERVLGTEHPSTLVTMNNLANVLSNQGMYQPAEKMYRSTLAVMERVLGTEHPSTLVTMNNLANVLSNQGMYQPAEKMYRSTLAVMERVLGMEHPSTLVGKRNLAGVLIRQDKYVEAGVILRRTLMLTEKVLGKEHPFTLATTISLGDFLRAQDEYIEAEKLLLFVLTQPAQTSNVHLPDIQRGLDSLTSVLSHCSKSQMIDAITEDEQNKRYCSVLQTASLRGTWGLVQQLAEKRVKIDFSKVECSKALQTAADHGHHIVVHLLLLYGAKTVSGDSLHSALQAASASGHEPVVRLLLEAGANANLKLENHSSALQAASAGGHEAVVRLLLDRKADANVMQEHFGSALQAASASGHEAVVRLLLDRQIDANAQVEHYGNALQAASAGGHQGLVRLLTDKSVLFSSYYDSGIFREEGDTATFSSVSASTVSLALTSVNSDRSFLASSATSFENEIPENIFTILTLEVLLDPDVKGTFERILALRGSSHFMSILRRNIREFCSTLSEENPTDIQRGSIWLLRRFKAYFAFRVCQLLKPSTTREGKQIEDLVDQTAEAGVERYLQDLHRAVQPQRDAAVEGSTSELSIGETASSDYRNAEDHARYSEYWDNQSSESDSSDDEPEIIPQSLTNETISWLTRGIAFLNFKHSLIKHISSPLQYVHQVVQPILSASKICSVTFHVEWELIQYTKSELEEGDTIVQVLTVTGGIVNAEATSCLDYCRRIWPETGEFVVMALEKAIRTGWHSEYYTRYLEIGS
jgi:tetratricopeptide (TPR) repeat protein